jgi:hypothetical protein
VLKSEPVRGIPATSQALTATTETDMVEAADRLSQAPAMSQVQCQALAMRQARAVAVLVQRAAVAATKRQLQAQGRRKVSEVPMREIVAMAEERLVADVAWRAKLIAEARPMVDQWTAEGFFGKRAAQSVRNVPELRTLTEQEARQCGGIGQ